ncbi:hypothetical protein [Maricaulis sp.]|uniref:hypothetical protein n=1 Tax=Maricaulis sp. TaxID=1486257 RepID=UPI002B26AD84|nr:hypothetical protein [Maricaulis sp.]
MAGPGRQLQGPRSLGISSNTVKAHLVRPFDKRDVSSPVRAITAREIVTMHDKWWLRLRMRFAETFPVGDLLSLVLVP